MYPNLFKHLDLSKLCNDVSKPIDLSLIEEKALCLDEEEKYPELSVKMFFDFMKTAYQVNETFEELASTLSANSEIDWATLVKVSLNLKETEYEAKSENVIKEYKKLQTTCLREPNNLNLASEAEAIPINVQESESLITPLGDRSNQFLNIKTSNKNNVYKSKSLTTIESAQIKKEYLLTKVMKRCLSDVLHEGLLDSVLPYMIPKHVLSQPTIKKSLIMDSKKSSFISNDMDSCIINAITGNKEKDKDKNKQKNSIETEVEIHVCDEVKNIKKNFRCPQRLLIQKMCYFADVTTGQKLEEMDISVHCDVVIFDWLMRWVKKDIIKTSEWPVLEAHNVIPIMVSASFLQMYPLLESCLIYCHINMSEILKTTTILTCLNDNLLTKLADLYTNIDVETIKDKKDKIQSRLFCKLIMSLSNSKPDNKKGHFDSLATFFKCVKCEKNVVSSVSNLIPCIPSNMRIDIKGNLHSKHTRDMTWNLNNYIINLRAELRSWRKIYWRLWGDCHFLFCRQCGIYFPINQMDWCSYHPENPQFFINEQQKILPLPLGRYPCCSQRAYKFQIITNKNGCKFREHVPEIISEKDENIINIFLAYREIISIAVPQLFFPEKITRLLTHDPLLPPGKLWCKETFWWEGIEIIPPRPKFGLLAKIWGGSGLHKSYHISSQKMVKKIHQRSLADVSSISSEFLSDEDEKSQDENSSIDEESIESEEFCDCESTDVSIKKNKTKFNILKTCEGMGAWSPNLTIRYNQDNQRDFEEKAAVQMIALLSKRAMLELNLHLKTHSSGKHSTWNNSTHPIGGSYVQVEVEFFNQIAQNSKCKNNVSVKGSTRFKTSK
ncbi:PREDICTED: uncharacterized protein KIAA1841 homolog [Ceratosolen solmsi marchali]|uniref:Uncharacterized protein KIAA1841 homolog n=1 Tax=Ceratosolen solmsi marchali TaxID=326594 RepID=A0AAJ6YLA4_9HYME|nr:PREDICTED: uncharacterized protein KIAA1841 homolog [Ceratosolen solmsi marchali]